MKHGAKHEVKVFAIGALIAIAPWLWLVGLQGVAMFLPSGGAGGLAPLGLPIFAYVPGQFLLHIHNRDLEAALPWISLLYAVSGGLLALAWDAYKHRERGRALRICMLSGTIVFLAYIGASLRAGSLTKPYVAHVVAAHNVFKCNDGFGIELQDDSSHSVYAILEGGVRQYLGSLKEGEIDLPHKDGWQRDEELNILGRARSPWPCRNSEGKIIDDYIRSVRKPYR